VQVTVFESFGRPGERRTVFAHALSTTRETREVATVTWPPR
jgi:hypothetical protein